MVHRKSLPPSDYGRILLHEGTSGTNTIRPVDIEQYFYRLEVFVDRFMVSNTGMLKLGSEWVMPKKHDSSISASMHSAYNMRGSAGDARYLRENDKYASIVSSGLIAMGRVARLRRGEKISGDMLYEKLQDAIAGKYAFEESWGRVMKEYGLDHAIYLIKTDDVRSTPGGFMLKPALAGKIAGSLKSGMVVVLNEDDEHTLKRKMRWAGHPEESEKLPFTNNEELTRIYAYTLRHTDCTPNVPVNRFPPVEEYELHLPEGRIECKPFFNPNIYICTKTALSTKESIKNGNPQVISVADNSTGLEMHIAEEKSDLGTGGMRPKLDLAKWAGLSNNDMFTVIIGDPYNERDRYSPQKSKRDRPGYSLVERLNKGELWGKSSLILPNQIF